jgi:hypothetical protein
MHRFRRWWPSARAGLIVGVVGLSLAGLSLACRPSQATAVPTPAAADAFAVVRATAEAAYQSGKAHLDRGELEPALIDLDTASTNDADNRQDIQLALAQTISQLQTETPTVVPTPLPRAPVIATPLLVATPLPLAPGVATPVPPTLVAPAPPLAPAIETLVPPTLVIATPLPPAGSGVATPLPPTLVVASLPATTPEPAGSMIAPILVVWRDPQGRFSVSAPTDWATAEHAQALFGVGSGVVQFRDASGRSELDIAVDSQANAVSPELYSASVELALQQHVPGYTAEQTLPENVSGSPSIRRVFTFTQRDASGLDYQARGFQVTVVNGTTPYVISGSAPADQFQAASVTFEQMVETFRFG